MNFDPKPAEWSLDPQLQKDTLAIGDLPLSRVLLIEDANYPWLLLVPRRRHSTEIIDLDYLEQTQLMAEIAHSSRVLKTMTQCDKINVAALGNVVPQLHVHIIARSRGDAAWPRPVWNAVPPKDYEPAAREQFVAALRLQLALPPMPA